MSKTHDYVALADWAEQLDPDTVTAGQITRGAAAAAEGRRALQQAGGDSAEVRHALGGRPRIDPDAPSGEHAPIRRVRVAQAMSDRLDALAAAQHRNASEVIRDALTEYLDRHRTPA